jgi:hypothetical protein
MKDFFCCHPILNDPNHYCSADIIYFHCAEQYVQKKFDATNEEIFKWITHNCNHFPKYDKDGNPYEYGEYYDRNTIKSFDFINNSLFRHERIISDSIVLSGLEASRRLREKYKLKKDCKWHDWTIEHLLSQLTSLESNTPDKNGMLLTTKSLQTNAHTKENTIILSVSEHYANLFYLEEEINNLSAFIPFDYQYISFQELMQLDHWSKLTEKEVITVLKKQNQEQTLTVFDSEYFYPKWKDLTKIPNHYGEEAQALTEESTAVFKLSEIVSLEEFLFPEPQEEREHKRNKTYHLDKIKEVFGVTLEWYRQERKVPPNKNIFAQKMIKLGKKKKMLTTSIPKDVTIERNINELSKRGMIPEWKSIKSELIELAKKTVTAQQ